MPTQEAKAAISPAGFSPEYIKDGSKALNALLADVFALYIKTKNFHWHMEDRISATTTCCSMNRATRSLP
jgi:starvation-inducible DNA-binding protein